MPLIEQMVAVNDLKVTVNFELAFAVTLPEPLTTKIGALPKVIVWFFFGVAEVVSENTANKIIKATKTRDEILFCEFIEVLGLI